MGKSTTVPTIAVPPRGSMETLFANGSGPGFSPGPMTLVSSFFSEQSPYSFSQLLAGAMNSPMAMKPGYMLSNNKDSESDGGYKRNRPVGLVVGGAQNQMQQQQQVDSLGLNLSPMFMFPPGLSPSGLLSPLQSPFGMSHQQALAHVTAQAAFSQSYMQMQAEIQRSTTTTAETAANHSPSAPNETSTQERNPTPTEPEILKLEASEVSQFDHKVTHVAIDKPASDGYNWRKYGQKHVKGSEFPRSYYKCTHLNCPVKKKVERSSDGRVNEITYKGQHNHDLPQPSKRGKESCVLDRTTNSEVKAVLASSQDEANELSETARVTSEFENFQATNRDSAERHPYTNNDTVDNAIVLDDEDDDEPSAKRRNVDVGPTMPAPSHQTVSEAKIVVQTRSEVDLLDDGFKWRKYGQKIVKGNSHPRSYYRCTYPGCNVRKQVERASADPKSVITTYEGKHDHEIPKGKYSNHGTTNASSQQLKTHKTVAQNPLQNKEMDYGNIEQTPMTLQLKDEQIAA